MENAIIQNILEYSKGKMPSPVKLDLFLTQGCNLKCVFCGCHATHKDKLKEEIQESSVFRLIDEALEIGVSTFGILGGEPFTKKDLMLKIMEKIKSKNANGAITTNGTLFDYKTVEKIVSIKWDMIRFSIDGANAETHDDLRGVKGSFKACIQALETFKKAKEEAGSYSPSIEFSTVLCNRNYKELKGIIKIAKDAGCKKIYFLPVIELTDHVKKLKLNKGESENHIREAELFAKSQDLNTNLGEIIGNKFIEKTGNVKQVLLKKRFKNNLLETPCYQPWYGLAVHANGHVVPCANFSDNQGEDFVKGSLKNIWLGKYFEGIRKKLLDNQFPEACSRCCMPLVEENRMIKEKLKEKLVELK